MYISKIIGKPLNKVVALKLVGPMGEPVLDVQVGWTTSHWGIFVAFIFISMWF